MPEWLRAIVDFVLSLFGYKPKPTVVIEDDGGAGESEEEVETAHEEIDNSPTGITETEDGGLSMSGFNRFARFITNRFTKKE